MSKNVLFISYDGMTDALGQSQVIPYLSGLSALGHSITIISAEKPEAFKKLSASIESQLAAAKISWHPVLFSNQIPGLSAWRNYTRLLNKAKGVCLAQKIEIVHGRSYIPSMIGIVLKKKFGVRMIFDMRGFWADERVEGGLWNLRNPIYKIAYNFFKRKEKELLLESDAIVSLTENGKKEILSWKELKLPPEKITVIPCCADIDFFSEKNVESKKQDTLKKKLGIQTGDFILSYSGSLGTWYLLEEMLQFFSYLMKKKKEAKFLFITYEPKEKILECALLYEIPPEKIIVMGVARNEMPLMLSLSSMSIFFIKNSFSKKASSPTKMGEVMSMGIPVICNAGVGDVEEIISQTQAGICVSSLTKENFETVIDQLNELLMLDSSKISEAAKKYFSLKRGTEKYDHIYHSLT